MLSWKYHLIGYISKIQIQKYVLLTFDGDLCQFLYGVNSRLVRDEVFEYHIAKESPKTKLLVGNS